MDANEGSLDFPFLHCWIIYDAWGTHGWLICVNFLNSYLSIFIYPRRSIDKSQLEPNFYFILHLDRIRNANFFGSYRNLLFLNFAKIYNLLQFIPQLNFLWYREGRRLPIILGKTCYLYKNVKISLKFSNFFLKLYKDVRKFFILRNSFLFK